MLVGTSTLGNPDNCLHIKLHQESDTCLVDKLGLNRSQKETGGLKVLNTLMLCRSTGSWRPFTHLGKAISCWQVDLGTVDSLSNYSARPISNRSKSVGVRPPPAVAGRVSPSPCHCHVNGSVLPSVIRQLLGDCCIKAWSWGGTTSPLPALPLLSTDPVPPLHKHCCPRVVEWALPLLRPHPHRLLLLTQTDPDAAGGLLSVLSN